jgi:hypothetical protein
MDTPSHQERSMEPAVLLHFIRHRIPPYKPFLFIVLERLNAAEMSVTWLNEAFSPLLCGFMNMVRT